MHDTVMAGLFYVFAGIVLLAGLMVITQKNPVRCVLFLVVAFLASAVLWLFMSAEFLGLILVLVYVGAVMTLFLFVVMMLNINVEASRRSAIRYVPFGLLFVALLIGLLWIAMPASWLDASVVMGAMPKASGHLSNTEAIGMVLYTEYVAAFELAAVILLVAMISAIALAHRAVIRSKRQVIRQQLMTRAEDRLTLHSMNPHRETRP